MKKILSLLISCSMLVTLLCGCSSSSNDLETTAVVTETEGVAATEATTKAQTQTFSIEDIPSSTENIPDFKGMDDPQLTQFLTDRVYAELSENLASDDYKVESVTAAYLSQEYLDESDYNAKTNLYFGYSIDELDKQFHGKKYVFTLGDNNETVAVPINSINDETYKEVLKNVAVGTGVILVCVSVSLLTGGAGTPSVVHLIFTAAATKSAQFAISSSVFAFVSTFAVKAYQTADAEEALKAAALKSSTGFKWGAIIGATVGGVSEGVTLAKEAAAEKAAETIVEEVTIPTPRQSELTALEKFPGREQVSYLAKSEVPYGTPGATRPDIVQNMADGAVHAREVKNYDLQKNLPALCKELRRQIAERVENLPEGSVQSIILDIRGRGYSEEFVKEVISSIQNSLSDIYTNIPIELIV